MKNLSLSSCTPWWNATCQDEAADSSPLATHVIHTVWLWACILPETRSSPGGKRSSTARE